VHSFTLTDLAKIIERESKESTYKFALLRGTIDIIQNSPNLKEYDGAGRFYYPMGSLVLKWVEYYFPLFEHEIPQRPGKYRSKLMLMLTSVVKEGNKFDNISFNMIYE